MGPALGDDHSGDDRRFVTPLYLLTTDSDAMVAGAFIVQGAFVGAIYGQNPSYLSRTVPDRGAGDRVGLLLPSGRDLGRLGSAGADLLRRQMNFGFAIPMLISTILFLVLVVISVLIGPETKGKTLKADLEVIKGVAQPAT